MDAGEGSRSKLSNPSQDLVDQCCYSEAPWFTKTRDSFLSILEAEKEKAKELAGIAGWSRLFSASKMVP